MRIHHRGLFPARRFCQGLEIEHGGSRNHRAYRLPIHLRQQGFENNTGIHPQLSGGIEGESVLVMQTLFVLKNRELHAGFREGEEGRGPGRLIFLRRHTSRIVALMFIWMHYHIPTGSQPPGDGGNREETPIRPPA